MSNLIELSRGPIVPGTLFRSGNKRMSSDSLIGSGEIRPHLVMKVNNGIAACVPMSSSSDAWNADRSPHVIPWDLNPEFFLHKGKPADSLYAVNRVVRDGHFAEIPVSQILPMERIDVPQEFVQMGFQLIEAYRLDRIRGRLPRGRGRRFKDARITKMIRRVELTTKEILDQYWPE